MYESKRQPLLPRDLWIQRLARTLSLAGGIIVTALGIGVLGYHFLAHLAWIDALVDASMILSGMGPVNPLTNDAGKVFASCYALFSGLVFIGVAGLLIAPWAHRLLHRMHADEADDEARPATKKRVVK